MRTWMSFSIAAVALAMSGAAVASDEGPDAPRAEPEVAADAPSPRGIEEVVATAKRPPPMEHASAGAVHVEVEAAFSAAPVEIATPEVRLARDDAPKLEARAPAESE